MRLLLGEVKITLKTGLIGFLSLQKRPISLSSMSRTNHKKCHMNDYISSLNKKLRKKGISVF